MNLLFLFVNLPNLTIGGNLYCDLINEFKGQGHKVCAVSIGINSKEQIAKENGIDVLRIPSAKTTSLSGVKKALNYQKIAYKYACVIPKYFKNEKFDWIVSHTLPPEIGLTAWWLKKMFNCGHYLIVSDFLWQDGVSLGLFGETNPVCVYYKLMEKITFRNADLYSVPSWATIDFSKKYYPKFDENKVSIIRWWQKISQVDIDKGAIRVKYGISNKFVVVYGGSIGLMQRGNYFLDLANSVKDKEEILFLLLGQGDYLKEVEKDANKLDIHNIKFQKFLPQHEYNELLAACNVGMIILNENVGTPNIPSKTVSYYCYGIPILAAVDKITDLGKVLETDGTGFCSFSGDNDTLRNNLLKMYYNPDILAEMSENEKKIYNQSMTPKSAYCAIVTQIESYNK